MSRTEKRIAALSAPCHECAPAEWRTTRDITGSYELDAVIERCTNADVLHRLAYYLERDTAYGPLTGYDAYHGYSGDN